MKFRPVITALLVAFVTACASAPTPQPEVASTEPVEVPVAERQPLPEEPPPLLWVVEGEAGRMYLFGTMHFGVTYEQLPDEVGRALADSDTFVLEANPNGADPTLLAEMMMLGDGPGLDEQLGTERWEKLLSLVGEGFEPRVARRLQPWVLEAALLQKLMPADEPMELGLLEIAQRRGLKVAFLEDWKTQIRLLNRMSTPDMLAEIVDDPEAFRDRTLDMSTDYVVGDIDALREKIFGQEYSSEVLFETRNKTWLPKLTEYAHRGDVFVAIGAGHLIGEDSVLDLLKAEGFSVRRVE